jgi:gliding motility-associated-like protein
MKSFIKSILPIVALLFAINAKGQFVQMTHFAGTVAYGGVNVTVTPGGSFTTGGGICFGPPTEYWASPGGPGWYDYTFSVPVYQVKFRTWGINGGPLGAGEYCRMSINGSTYALQPADVVSYTDCSPGGGPMYLNAGDWMGPVGTTGNYNGGTYIITVCTGITSCRLWCNGSLSGVAYWAFFDPTRPPSCVHADNNGPCIGDSLILNLAGDSTGATYAWTGPGGFTSSLQRPWKFPSTWADTGWYKVIRHAGVVNDTDSTHVVIHPLPVLNISSNAPLCVGMLDTLRLAVNPGGVGDLYSWTGPNSFTSTLQYPIKPGYLPIDTGWYKVVETTPFGCKDSARIDAGLVPPPPPPHITGDTAYCYGATFVPFVVTGIGVINWFPTSTSTVGTTVAPVVNTTTPGIFTYYANQSIGSCESPKDSITVKVYPQVVPNFTYTIHRGCTSDQVLFVNTSTGAVTYSWDFGDESLRDLNANPPVHTFDVRKTYTVTLTARNEHPCVASFSTEVDTWHDVKAIFSPTPDTLCVNPSGPTTLMDGSWAKVDLAPHTPSPGLITNYEWSFGDGATDATLGTPPAHTYNQAGIYVAKLVVTDSIGCKDSTTRNIYVLRVDIKSVHDTTLCLIQPMPLRSLVTVYPVISSPFTYLWSTNTDNLDNLNVQIPYVTGFGEFVDTLTATIGPGCFARDTIFIHSVKGAVLTQVTASATIHYGSSIQLNASNEVLYYWKPNDGSLNNPNINNPIATPQQNTVYTVYGYDKNGCMDSATVDVKLDYVGDGIPSGFTPNGDGLNDVFRPAMNKFEKLVEFSVYNRWGQQLFQTNDKTQGWDGTYHGAPQDLGTYYYMIILASPQGGDNKIYKGEVTLIR